MSDATTSISPKVVAGAYFQQRRHVRFTAWGIERTGMILRTVTDEGFSYSNWRNPTEALSMTGYCPWDRFGGTFTVDAESEAEANRERFDRQKQEAKEAVRTIQTAVNGSTGGAEGLLEGLRAMHATLLGKLFNAVVEVAAERDGDGRLCDVNMPLGEKTRILGEDAKVSDVRQRFI